MQAAFTLQNAPRGLRVLTFRTPSRPRRAALFQRPDAATTEHAEQGRFVRSAVEIAVGVEDGARAAGKCGEAVELEVLSMMILSAFLRPSALRTCHSAADQISPFSCS